MNGPLSQVEIRLDGGGQGHVFVNGQDVAPALDAVQIIAEANKAPQVIMHLKAGIDVKLAGVVTTADPQRSAVDVITSFLAEVNPDELEEKALNRTDPVPVAFLEVLKELARTWQAST